MKIPQDIIDRVSRETDIVEIVSEVVPLKKAGSNYKGLCPFHGEKTPSFNVNSQKQIFHCFGCGEGGDAIAFLMKHGHLSFVEAIERLAQRLKIQIPRHAEDAAKTSQQDIYHKINAYAHWFFREELRKSPATNDYLKTRGLSPETIESFELGFAPESFDSLLKFFDSKKIPLEKAAELGLLKRHAESGRYYDFYRGRLIFPIFSAQGKIIGFGGRALSGREGEAKYINSPESPVYRKSYELYGLYQAKKTVLAERQVVIVEGYVDVLASVQLGLAGAVAPLGTSLTADQVRILKRFAEEIVVMFDGDEAGKKAAVRAFGTCLEAGIHPKIAALPDGQDPGDFLKLTNVDKTLKDRVKNAPYGMDWLMAQVLNQGAAKTMDKAKSMKFIASWIAKLPDEMQKLAYRKKLAECFDVPVQELNKVVENTKNFVRFSEPEKRALGREELIILSFIKEPAWFAKESLSRLCEDFENAGLKDLGRFLENFFKKHETFAPSPTIRDVPQELAGIFTRILTCSESYGDLNLNELVQQKKFETKKKRLKMITAKIREAELGNDAQLKMRLLAEKQTLLATKDS